MTWWSPDVSLRWATLQIKEGCKLAYIRGASEPFLQKQIGAQNYGQMGPTVHVPLIINLLISVMATHNAPLDVHLSVILAKLETSEMVEVPSVAKWSLTQHLTILKPIIMMKLLRPSVVLMVLISSISGKNFLLYFDSRPCYRLATLYNTRFW